MIIFPNNRPLQNLGKIPSQTTEEIGPGFQGNLNTVQTMIRVARQEASDPLINRLAKNIIHDSGVKSHQYREECRIIGEWVKKHVRYIRDPNGMEQLSSPTMLVRQMQEIGYAAGDCDDMALLIATLLLSIGAQPFLKTVRFKSSSGNYNHIYVVVYETNLKDSETMPQKEMLIIDAIVKDRPIGFELNYQSGDEYRV